MTVPQTIPPRRRRPVLDPRLAIGVLLVVASVAAVVGIVAMSDRRTPVYAAASALSPGERVDASDLVRRSVALDGSDALYLSTADLPAAGLVVTHPVARGELVPASSVGSATGVGSTSIVLELATRASAAVKPGATVDVWAAPAEAAGAGEATPAPPSVLVAGATVVRLVDDAGSFSAKPEGSTVEVLVPRSRVARVLAAVAGEDAIAVLPAGLPWEPRS